MTLAWKWHARDAFAEECSGLGFWKMHVGCREDGRDVEEVAVREASLSDIRVERPSVEVLPDSEYCIDKGQCVKLRRTASKWMINTGP